MTRVRTVGLKNLEKLEGNLVKLKKAVKRKPTTKSIISKPWKVQNIKKLYEQASIVDKDKPGIIKLSSIRSTGLIGMLGANPSETEKDIIKDFSSRKNRLVLTFPDLGSHQIAMIPKPSDLVAKRKSKHKWDILLKDKTIARIKRSLEKSLAVKATEDLKKEIDKIRKGLAPDGVEQKVEGTLGLAVDGITINPGGSSLISNLDLTKKVRQEMKRRMGKGQANKVLNYRKGDFVKSVNVSLRDNIISYKYNKRRYSIHEKEPAGILTHIVPKRKSFLVFFNHKKGHWQRAKSVNVMSRPIIKKSIRSVALKELGKKFNIRELN